MRIKLDENLPIRLAQALAELGHDVDTVPAEGLAGRNDPEVWAATQEADRFFITQDLDFSDARAFAPGSHHGLLLVRLREPGRTALAKRVLAIFAREGGADLVGCFVVASDRKTRVLRP
jgi:predicted nuclease of predicted toxin-antitoxin system